MHPNPGPGSNANCGRCDFFGETAVSWSDEGVCCDECDLWHHRSCTEMCIKDYSLINRSSVQWYCFNLFKRETLNVSSFTFHSYEINPSYYDLISLGGRDSSVVRAPDSRLKGRGFKSLLEQRENYLLQGWLSVLTLISVSVPPPCYRSSM